MSGKVYLVGAGPGDPELLTLKAMRILLRADLVLHDDLVTGEILALVPLSARTYSVGKRCGKKKITQEEVNAQMVAGARAGLQVVRLKGGDPLIFGRLGEEMEALRKAGVNFEVVPGVTAASAAAASAQIPLTERGLASKLVFSVGHCAQVGARNSVQPAASADSTIAVYMPANGYHSLAEELTRAGWSPQTPCLIVSRASTPQEQIWRTTLGELPEAPGLPAPSTLIVGAVAEMLPRETAKLIPQAETIRASSTRLQTELAGQAR